MKKKILSALLLSTLILPAAHAADGTINFTGTIVATACNVDANSKTQTVDMGTISSEAFPAKGAVGSVAKFNIKLSNCDAAITQARIRFDGQADSNDMRLIALTGSAKGLGMALYERDGTTLIPINTSSTPRQASGTPKSITLDFVAKLMSTAANPAGITVGAVTAVTNFTVDYK